MRSGRRRSREVVEEEATVVVVSEKKKKKKKKKKMMMMMVMEIRTYKKTCELLEAATAGEINFASKHHSMQTRG